MPLPLEVKLPHAAEHFDTHRLLIISTEQFYMLYLCTPADVGGQAPWQADLQAGAVFAARVLNGDAPASLTSEHLPLLHQALDLMGCPVIANCSFLDYSLPMLQQAPLKEVCAIMFKLCCNTRATMCGSLRAIVC